MATSMLRELRCSVCLETYTDPVTLPCMHSFCRQCLLNFSRECSTNDRYHRYINCPECRQNTYFDEQCLRDLPKNCTLANLVEKLDKGVEKLDKGQENKYDPNCSVCDTTPARLAVKVCFDCNISYCCECVALHPSRGVLANHVLVDVNDDNSSTESLVSKKAEERGAENDTCIFCHTCNELVEDYECHLDHKTSGLKEARMIKCKSFGAILEKLNKTRRDLRRGIYQSESHGERLQEKKHKQLRDVVSVDKVNTSLALKDSELTQQINQNEMDIKDKKEQLPKIIYTITRVQTLLEQDQNDPSFLKRSVEFEKGLHSFAHSEEGESSQLFETFLVDIKKTASEMVNVLEEKRNSSCLINKTDRQLKYKVRLISVKPQWDAVFGRLLVRWSSTLSELTYDVKVQELDPEQASDDLKTILYSSNRRTEFLIPNLLLDTGYRVSVMIQGHPETESDQTHVKTLPSFTGKLTMGVTVASSDMELRADGSKIEHKDHSKDNVVVFENISGTISSNLLLPLHYWETDLRFFLGRLKHGETAYDIGICLKKHVDNIPNIRQNQCAFICCHSKKGRDAFFEFYANGKRIQETKVDWKVPFELKLGFFLNMYKKQFSIINVDSGENIMTFKNITQSENYVAVFGSGDDSKKVKLSIKLNTFTDIKRMPKVVLTKLL